MRGHVACRILAGHDIPARNWDGGYKTWIAGQLEPAGRLTIDAGAVGALGPRTAERRDREIEQLRREKASLVIVISDAIEKLKEDNEKTVLTEFYIARAPMTEVANAINYSVRRAYHFRKMGVTHLGEVLG